MKEKRLEVLLVFTLLLVVLAVNLPVIGGGFLWDDFSLIVANEKIKSLSNVKDFFTKGFWENSAEEGRKGGYYRPIILLSYALDYKLHRLRPWGYHFTNLIFFLLSVLLLYLVLKKLEGNYLLALAAALFFGLHPLAKEPMGWVAGRTDLISGFFLLISTYLFLKHLEKKRGWVVGLSLLSFALAMLSKEASYVFPLFLVALVLYKARDRFWAFLPEFFAFGLFALGFFFLSLKISYIPDVFYPPRAYSFLSNSLKTLGYYFSKAVLPLKVSPVPDFVRILSSSTYLWVGMFFLVLLFFFPFRPVKKLGFYPLAAFIFLIPALAPLILTTPTPIANRFAYMGLFFLSVLPFVFIERFTNRTVALAAVFLLCLPVGHLSLQFSRLYSSEGKFWAMAYRMSPNSPVVHINYASYLVKSGKYREALRLLKKLSRGKNIPVKLLIIKAQAEAKARFLLGEFEEGEKVLLRALQYPYFFSKDAYLYLVNFYSLTRQIDKMERLSRLLIRALKTRDYYPYEYVAYARIIEGDYEETKKFMEKMRALGAPSKEIEDLQKLKAKMEKLQQEAESNALSQAMLLFLRGRIEESDKIVNALLMENPHRPGVLLLYLKIKLVSQKYHGWKDLIDFVVERAKTPLILDQVFSYFWFQWMDPKPSAYVLERSLEKFPNQPNFAKKRIILSYIEELLKGG